MCVCNDGVISGSKELPVGKNETHRVCILFTGNQCSQGPSEEMAKPGGGQCDRGPTVGKVRRLVTYVVQ